MTLVRSLIAVLTCLLAGSLFGADPADNWPHWRGPHLDGRSTTARNLPVSWSETENVVWRTRLPSWAAATPVVWEDTVFVTSAQEGFTPNKGAGMVDSAVERIKNAFNTTDQLLLLALRRQDGSIRWRKVIGEGNKFLNKQNMASPTPVTDGRHVWVMTGLGDLSCLDFEGNLVWKRNISNDYWAFGLAFGYASSPVLHDGRLYIQVLHGMKTDEPSYLVAVDAASGKTLWQVERPTDAVYESPDSYSTPMLVEADGKTRLVVAGGDYLTGHDLDTGREVWRAGGTQPPEGPQLSHDRFSACCPGYCFCAEPREALHRFPCGRQRECFGVAPALVNAVWAGRAYSGERRRTALHRQRQGDLPLSAGG